ncbi:MAG: M67 family metallopeptidase [Rhodospirillales bacterium]|nr:M67 family metallopeptidase [Rhodospirillales bacterium]
MIHLKASQARLIEKLAEAAYPSECCGLLIGRRLDDGSLAVDELRPCRNLLAEDRGDRFEIDPQDRFDAMRQARSLGREILGHFHSHPDAEPEPSATDRQMIYEPELVWLIVAVQDGQAGGVKAFMPLADAGGFRPLALVIDGQDGQNPRP